MELYPSVMMLVGAGTNPWCRLPRKKENARGGFCGHYHTCEVYLLLLLLFFVCVSVCVCVYLFFIISTSILFRVRYSIIEL